MCHGDRGEGRIGSRLAKSFASAFPAAFIKQVVTRGVNGSVMPAWAQSNGGPLDAQQIDDVTAFVVSLFKTGSPTFIEPTATPSPSSSGALPVIGGLVLLGIAIAVVVFVSARGARQT